MLSMFVAALALLFLITAFRPRLGLIVLFFLLPSYLLKTELAGIPTTFLELGTYLAALAIVLRFYFDESFRVEAKNRLVFLKNQNKTFLILAALFFVAAIMAAVFTADLRRSLGVLKGWFFDPILAAFLLYITLERVDWGRLIAALSFSGSVLSIYGLAEYHIFYQDWYKDFHFRLNSIFTSANYLALYLGPVIGLSLGFLAFNREWKRSLIITVVLVLTSIINAAALFLGFSYGGYAGLALASLFLVIHLFRSGHNKKLAFTALILLVTAATLTGAWVIQSDKFQRDFYNVTGESSLRGRAEVWTTAIYIIRERPITGMGLGNFDKGYNQYVDQALDKDPLERDVIHAHNVFLDFWTQAGVLGFISFLALLIYAASIFSNRKKRGVLAYAAMAAMLTIIGHGLLDTPYFKNDLSYLFWLTITALLVSERDE